MEGFEEQVFRDGKDFLTEYTVCAVVFECFSKDGVFEILKNYGFDNIEQLSENNYCATKN